MTFGCTRDSSNKLGSPVRSCLDFTADMYLKNFSVYLRFFSASLLSRFLQIDHYLLRTESANLLKNDHQLNLK